ncbi:MAG: hypothetical protein NVS4B7_12270 [Ktedonobacteraceae bacterium]
MLWRQAGLHLFEVVQEKDYDRSRATTGLLAVTYLAAAPLAMKKVFHTDLVAAEYEVAVENFLSPHVVGQHSDPSVECVRDKVLQAFVGYFVARVIQHVLVYS